MLKAQSDLHTVVREIYPCIILCIVLHIALELVVNDSLKAVTSTNYISTFLLKLGSLFHCQQESKNIMLNDSKIVERCGQ